MIASILYLCLYAWHLVLPGYLIVRLLTIRRGTFLLSVAFSYSMLFLNLMLFEWFKAPVWAFALIFNFQIFILLAANCVVVWRYWRTRDGTFGRRWTWNSITKNCWQHRNRWVPPLATMTGVCVYLNWAGPYTELPADPWKHILRFLFARQINIESGYFNPFGVGVGSGMLDFFTRQGWHWYIMQALLCRWSNLAITDLPGPLTMANTMVFCLSIYGFALCVWSNQRIQRRLKIQASLWTVVFTVFWLGINIFAYIRYYVLAPALLNYVTYLAAVILILDYLRSRSWWGHALWLAPLLVMAINIIHSQEAVFTFFMGLGILLVMEGQWVWSRIRRDLTDRRAAALVMNMLKIHVLFVGGLIIFGLLFYYSLHKPLVSYSEFILRPLFHGEWLGQTWFIQPFTGQFAQVVTWWGVFVYGLFLLHIHYFKRQPFILAGMLMPCLIVFNPVTIAILSHWMPDLNTIYRFNYMIPLPFVAGFMAMRFSKEIKLWIGAGWHNGTQSCHRDWPAIIVQIKSMLFLRKIWAASALLGLAVLLMPFESLFGIKSNSRFYTLKPVSEGNDQRRWGDLIALVRKHPHIRLLTDPYTCILLNLIDAKVGDGSWWNAFLAQGTNRPALLRNLDRKQDWWLVVNRRNGEFSTNGYISGHWPADVLMHFPSFYPDDLILFIKQHPELFKEIWTKDQIQVYDVVESRLWE